MPANDHPEHDGPPNRTVLLCTGLLRRAGRVLLVASRYPNQPDPLWNLPGGRARDGELLADALVREWREEVDLAAEPGALLYASESFDRATATRFVNVTFAVRADGEPRVTTRDPHVVDVAWVPDADLAERVRVHVVREPLVAHLSGDARRYYAYADAGITIAFADDP